MTLACFLSLSRFRISWRICLSSGVAGSELSVHSSGQPSIAPDVSRGEALLSIQMQQKIVLYGCRVLLAVA